MSQKIYVLTEEKLIELLDKQKEICHYEFTEGNMGGVATSIHQAVHPPLSPSFDLPSEEEIRMESIKYTSDPMQQDGYVWGFKNCLNLINQQTK